MFDKLAKAIAVATAKAALDAIEDAIGNAWANGEGREKAHSRMSARPQETEFARMRQAKGGSRFAAPPTARQIEENVTAVLRRQVPPRDETPRSWIGGLPMLPENIEWPRATSERLRERGPVPLNFLAQIACADLPKELWGGLGPRQGWLVFFSSNLAIRSRTDDGILKVIHTPELGSERQNPADKLPVAEVRETEGYYPGLNYRRCPVDIVAMSNDPKHPIDLPFRESETGSPMPAGLSDILYNGAPSDNRPWHTKEEPFNWACWKLMIELTVFGIERQRQQDAKMAEARRKHAEELAAKVQPGSTAASAPSNEFDTNEMELALAALKEEESLLEVEPENLSQERKEARAQYVQQCRTRIAEQRAFLEGMDAPFDAGEFRRLLEDQKASRTNWIDAQEAMLRDLHVALSARDLYAPLEPSERTALETALSARHSQWRIGYTEGAARVRCPVKSTVSVMGMLGRYRSLAVQTISRDLYFADQESRGKIPEQLLTELEANARAIEYDRPHKLGGHHQPVQDSSAQPGKVLLFQLVNDDTIGFRCGDSGALFAWIDIDALERHDFSNVYWWTENT